jgi:transposase
MNQPEIFSATIGLSLPWEMTAVSISELEKRIDFTVDFTHNSGIACPCCGITGTTGGVEPETWVNINYLGHIAYLHAQVPYILCDCCGSKQVDRPWARAGSGFTRIM